MFLQTKDDGYVSNVSSILNSLITDNLKIILATTEKSKAFDDEDVSNDHLSNLSFTFPSVSKMINEEDNNSFVQQYSSKYKETPNAYAVRGFDVTMDVVLRLVTSENLPQSVEDSPLTAYVENKFGYKKKSFGWIISFIVISSAIYMGVDSKIIVFGAFIFSIFTEVFVGLGVLIGAIPFLGPLVVKIVSIPIFWILNALGYIISAVVIKKGYSTELAKSRVITLALLIGIIIGYITGHIVPLR